MKIFKSTVLIVLTLLNFILISSCSKDDEASSNQDSETFIRFSIGDADYDFNNIASALSSSITLNGNNGDGLSDFGDTRISIWLPALPQVGSYNVVSTFGGDYRVSFTSEPLGFDFDFADSGTITITSITDDFIEGTFTADITSLDDTTITISNGTFKGYYID